MMNQSEALTLLRAAKTATLSVIDFETGYPSGSLVSVAVDDKGWPLLLISSLARHHKSLSADNRASLLVQTSPALSDFRAGFQGHMTKLERSADLENLWAAHHGDAAGILSLADFSFWRMTPTLIHIVAGFGRIETIRL